MSELQPTGSVDGVILSHLSLDYHKQPKNLAELLECLNRPIKTVGEALHRQFSAINFRGARTHEVEISQVPSDEGYNNRRFYLPVGPNSMAICTVLDEADLEHTGEFLRLFLNQIALPPQKIRQGVVILSRVDIPYDESDYSFSVGILPADDELKNKSLYGLQLTSHGSVSSIPVLETGVTGFEYAFEFEEENDKLFKKLSYNPRHFIHPFVAKAVVEAANLVGRAIERRRVPSSF